MRGGTRVTVIAAAVPRESRAMQAGQVLVDGLGRLGALVGVALAQFSDELDHRRRQLGP